MSIYLGDRLLAGSTAVSGVISDVTEIRSGAGDTAITVNADGTAVVNQSILTLNDVVPASFSGQAGMALIVNDEETGLIFGEAGGGGGVEIDAVTHTDNTFMESGANHFFPATDNYCEILGSGFTDFTLGDTTNTLTVSLEQADGSYSSTGITFTRHGSTRITVFIPSALTGTDAGASFSRNIRVVNGLGQEADFSLDFSAGPSLTLNAGAVLAALPGEAISFTVSATGDTPITLGTAPTIPGVTITADETNDTWTATGTIPADAESGSTVYTFTATDDDSQSTSFDVTIEVLGGIFATDLGTSLQFSDRSHTGLWYQPSEGASANRHTNTFSIWFQRLGDNLRGGTNFQTLFQQFETTSVAYNAALYIDTSDRLVWAGADSTSLWNRTTSKRLDDFGSWYHVVIQQNGTGNLTMWINGEEITDFDTETTNSTNTSGAFFTTTLPMVLGSAVSRTTGVNNYISGNTGSQNYKFVGNIGQFIGCSGLAHNADAFGEFSDEGYWQPIDVSGNTSFVGNDGFILNFDDADNPFNDSSVNGNHFAIGSTSTASTSLSAADLNRQSYSDKYAVIDIKGQRVADAPLNEDANLVSINQTGLSSIGFSSGKYYVEMVVDPDGNPTNEAYLGWGENRSQFFTSSQSSGGSYSAGMFVQPGSGISGALYSDGTASNSLSNIGWAATAPGGTMVSNNEFAANDIVGMAIDADNDTVQWFRFDATATTTIATSSASHDISPDSTTSPSWRKPINIMYNSGGVSSGRADINFGQFDTTNFDARLAAVNTATGQTFTPLSTGNLPDPIVANQHFDTGQYTGNGSSQSITGLNYQPDLVVIKRSSTTGSWTWTDSVRGPYRYLISNATNAEDSTQLSAQLGVTSFNDDGFSIADSSANYNTNQDGSVYRWFGWRAGGDAAANTDGSVSTMVSANQDAGFSVVTYSGANSSGQTSTHGHGLSQAPDVIITKSSNQTSSWLVYHRGLTDASYYLRLQDVDGEISAGTVWGSTDPTDSVFTTGFSSGSGRTGYDYVAYCFHEVPGYSSFGSYVGNGSSDGPVVYTGFKPALVIIKRADGGNQSWFTLYDKTKNDGSIEAMYLNGTQAETGDHAINFYSEGFKLTVSSLTANNSGTRYVYMAFAEVPGKYSLGG